MGDLAANGHAFTVSGFGIPSGAHLALVCEAARSGLLARYELVLPYDEMAARKDEIAAFRSALGRPVLLAPVASSADEAKTGSKIELFVSHGFGPHRLPDIEKLLSAGVKIDGVVMRVGLDADLAAFAREIAAWGAARGLAMDLHLRIAANNPAANIRDDQLILRAVVELYAAALAVPGVSMLVDPFMDIDRGYFVRHGLVDRRCNLRAAGMAVEALTAYLGDAAGVGMSVDLSVTEAGGARVLTLRRPDRLARIVLTQPGAALPVTDALKAGFAAAPLVVPLDQPWVIASDQGSALAAPDGAWPRSLAGPVMLVGLPA